MGCVAAGCDAGGATGGGDAGGRGAEGAAGGGDAGGGEAGGAAGIAATRNTVPRVTIAARWGTIVRESRFCGTDRPAAIEEADAGGHRGFARPGLVR